jgi:flagellar biosynthesis protein
MKKQEAVALQYNKEKNRAPKVTAKGKGESAKKIIELANEHNIPIKKDEDLLELLSKVELNKEVPQEMYKAVAEVFSFIYKVTKKE